MRAPAAAAPRAVASSASAWARSCAAIGATIIGWPSVAPKAVVAGRPRRRRRGRVGGGAGGSMRRDRRRGSARRRRRRRSSPRRRAPFAPGPAARSSETLIGLSVAHRADDATRNPPECRHATHRAIVIGIAVVASPSSSASCSSVVGRDPGGEPVALGERRPVGELVAERRAARQALDGALRRDRPERGARGRGRRAEHRRTHARQPVGRSVGADAHLAAARHRRRSARRRGNVAREDQRPLRQRGIEELVGAMETLYGVPIDATSCWTWTTSRAGRRRGRRRSRRRSRWWTRS